MATNQSRVEITANYKYKSPEADQEFTLPDEDKAKIQQFVKELKDLAASREKVISGYTTGMAFDVFVHKKVDVLVNILRNDDGIVDDQELDLLKWYINVYLPKSESNSAYPEAAINLVYQDIQAKVKERVQPKS